jgi:hypothetical protein
MRVTCHRDFALRAADVPRLDRGLVGAYPAACSQHVWCIMMNHERVQPLGVIFIISYAMSNEPMMAGCLQYVDTRMPALVQGIPPSTAFCSCGTLKRQRRWGGHWPVLSSIDVGTGVAVRRTCALHAKHGNMVLGHSLTTCMKMLHCWVDVEFRNELKVGIGRRWYGTLSPK